ESLSGDGMNHVRGVADQRQPLADEGSRHEITERKRFWFVQRADLAELEPEPPFELGMKFLFVQRDDARSFRAMFGPHQRRAQSLQRQYRKRAGGQKMFFGAALVI